VRRAWAGETKLEIRAVKDWVGMLATRSDWGPTTRIGGRWRMGCPEMLQRQWGCFSQFTGRGERLGCCRRRWQSFFDAVAGPTLTSERAELAGGRGVQELYQGCKLQMLMRRSLPLGEAFCRWEHAKGRGGEKMARADRQRQVACG